MLRSAVRAERAGSRVSIFVADPYWADLFRLSLGFNSELHRTSHHKHWTQSRSNYWEDGWGSMMGMKLFKTITNDLHFVRVNSFVRRSGDGVTYLCRNLTFSVNQEPDKRQRRHWHRPRNVAAPNTLILQRSYLSGAVLCTMYHVPAALASLRLNMWPKIMPITYSTVGIFFNCKITMGWPAFERTTMMKSLIYCLHIAQELRTLMTRLSQVSTFWYSWIWICKCVM